MEPTHNALSEPGTAAEKADRLSRFRGLIAARDAELVAYWRAASPAAHARAMIDLARYAEKMVARTGFGKDPTEMFPGFRKRQSAVEAARSRHRDG